jgi:hypothetical protein
MRAAFATGALAAGFAVAALSALVIWIVTLVSGSTDAWAVAIWLIPTLGAVAAVATYVAELRVERGTQARKRTTGEPWAYRED